MQAFFFKRKSQWIPISFIIDITFYKFTFLFLSSCLLYSIRRLNDVIIGGRTDIRVLFYWPFIIIVNHPIAPLKILSSSNLIAFMFPPRPAPSSLYCCSCRKEKLFIDSGSHQITWCPSNGKKSDWKIDLLQHWCVACLSSKNMFIFLYLAVEVISQRLQSIADEWKDGNFMRISRRKVTNIKQWSTVKSFIKTEKLF